MSEKEKTVAEQMGESLRKLNEAQMERITLIAEGMAIEADRREREAANA